MARKIANVTTGGQLIGIYGGNFFAAFRWPIFLSLGLIAALISWGFWHGMSEQEVYFCGMRMWAWLWNWFEFSDTKEMVLNVTHSDRVKMTAVEIMQYPLVADAWTHATNLVRRWTAYGMVIAIPACVGWTMIAEKFGASAREEKFEKGAILVDWRTLLNHLTAYNEAVLAPVYRAALGPMWRLHIRGMKLVDWARAGLYKPYTIADMPFPATTEQSHVMLIGSTGKGKTVVLRDIVRQVRARGGRAVIFDLTGAFVEAFYDETRDVILNPTDLRCPQWSIFNECDSEVQFNNAAMALIPSTGERDDFWKPAARSLFVDIAMRLQKDGRGTNQALHDELMTADLQRLHELAVGTIAAGVTDPDSPKMAEGVRSTFNVNGRALRLLPTTGDLFSIRDWVLEGKLPGERGQVEDGILFLTSRHIDMATTRALLTLWMDTAVNTLMTLPQAKQLRMWFIIDEVGALHRLPSIENGMQAARQYGGAFVLGIHAFAKLADTYGENIAMTLSSYANTKLVMGTADHGTAKWASESIGARMFREMEEGYSYGQTNVRDAVTLTPRKVTEALVIPDQLMKLPKLWGYMVFPEGMPVALVPIKIRDYPAKAPGFLPREIKDDPWSVEEAAKDVLDEPDGHGPGSDAAASSSGDVVSPTAVQTTRSLNMTFTIGPSRSGILHTSPTGETRKGNGVRPPVVDGKVGDAGGSRVDDGAHAPAGHGGSAGASSPPPDASSQEHGNRGEASTSGSHPPGEAVGDTAGEDGGKLPDESEGPGSSGQEEAGGTAQTEAKNLPKPDEREPALEAETSQVKPAARQMTGVPAAVLELRQRSDKAVAKARAQAERGGPPLVEAKLADPKADQAAAEREAPSPLEAMMGLPNRARGRGDRRDRNNKEESAQQQAQRDGNLVAAIQDRIDHQPHHAHDARNGTEQQPGGTLWVGRDPTATKAEAKAEMKPAAKPHARGADRDFGPGH